jgi:hypothetical protein
MTSPREVLILEPDAEGHAQEWLQHLVEFVAADATAPPQSRISFRVIAKLEPAARTGSRVAFAAASLRLTSIDHLWLPFNSSGCRMSAPASDSEVRASPRHVRFQPPPGSGHLSVPR